MQSDSTNTGDSIESVSTVFTQLSVNDNDIASTLRDMGFSENGIQRAALNTNQMHRGKSKSNLKTLNICISLTVRILCQVECCTR